MFQNNSVSDFLEWASTQNFLRMNTADLMWRVMGFNQTKIGPQIPAFKGHIPDESRALQEQLGIITGIFLAFLLKLQIDKARDFLDNQKGDVKELALKVFSFVLTLLLSPLLIAFTLLVWAAKHQVGRAIKRKHGRHFKGFLEGQDVVWTIENENSRSVINVLAQISIDSHDYEPLKTSQKILLGLRERISSSLLEGEQKHPKMFYRRKCEFGYHFWSSENPSGIETYIRHLDLWSDESEFITRDQLRAHLSELCNSKLPEDHSRGWELLVGRQPMRSQETSKLFYPVVFRVSHTVGDGVALLRLFLENIADSEESAPELKGSSSRLISESFNLRSFQKTLESLKTAAWVIFNGPYLLMNLTVFQKMDRNCLHPGAISGEKVISWAQERDVDFGVLDSVKAVKAALPGVRFSDVLTTALSRSLHSYFKSKQEDVPEDVTLVFPARIAREGPTLRLRNLFSVAMQGLPVNFHARSTGKASRLHELVERIKALSDQRAASPDYHINYWIMSWVGSMLPSSLFSKLFDCNPATFAFSNLPGPQEKFKIAGFTVDKVGFFLPNFSTTAVGITVLSYGNQLQFGIMADKAAIKSNTDAGLILGKMLEEIREMKQLLIR